MDRIQELGISKSIYQSQELNGFEVKVLNLLIPDFRFLNSTKG